MGSTAWVHRMGSPHGFTAYVDSPQTFTAWVHRMGTEITSETAETRDTKSRLCWHRNGLWCTRRNSGGTRVGPGGTKTDSGQLAHSSSHSSFSESSSHSRFPFLAKNMFFYCKTVIFYRKNDQEKIFEIFVHVAPEKPRLNQVSEKSGSKNSF